MNSSDPVHQEIIIIRRGNSEDEGHHGGAWKIAFADFMTAMMALFLVLWLINAANEETKRAVASYFNPVKLVDRNRSSKGVNDQRGGLTSDTNGSGAEEPETKQPEKPSDAPQAKTGIDPRVESDIRFFASPQEQLDTIVAAAQESPMLLGSTPKPQPDAVVDNFADPFGPDFWNHTKGGDHSKNSMTEPALDAQEGAETDEIMPTTTGSFEGTGGDGGEARNTFSSEAAKAELVRDLKEDVRKSLAEMTDDADELGQIIEIKSVDEGILISVTDELDVPMFKVGSAVPEAPLVLAIDSIAKSLSEKSGHVRVFGHTDARQYKNSADGNWRLSTDRAKSTYFMLVHGGLAEQRILEISGFADRKLRNKKDPLADQNRRIEILFETK
ncbi:MAG: flagellar motor protein MotB [Rhizobiaceae bacterium]